MALDHEPNDLERVYAFIAGLGGIVSDALANLGEGSLPNTEVLDRMVAALLRDLLGEQPCDARTLGPEPLAQAARVGQRPSHRVKISEDELPVHMCDVHGVLADAVGELFAGVEGYDSYVEGTATMAASMPRSTERFFEVAEERESELLEIGSKNRERGAQLIEAILDCDSPEPTTAQVEAIAAGIRYFVRYEASYVSLMESLASADGRDEALATLDAFLSEVLTW
jgi:hypothetical protein